jgi:hypothetical protein
VQVRKGETAQVSFLLSPEGGSIRISSVPAGATVLLDGTAQQSMTPCTLDAVPAGEHQIIIRKAGYEDDSREVVVEEGETFDISADLVPLSSGSSESTSSDEASTTGSRADGYAGRVFKPALQGEIRGNITIVTIGNYSGLLSSGDNQTYSFSLTVPEQGKLMSSRMYVYTTWAHDERTRTGESAVCTLTLNGRPVPVTTTYQDRKGTGTFDYPAETFVCTLSGDQIRDGQNEIVVSNTGGENHAFAVYGAALVMFWEEPDGPRIYYWIGEGSDIVLNDPEFGIVADESGSSFVFPGIRTETGVEEASLIVISTAASGEEEDQNRILFNDAEWLNVLSAGSSDISRVDLDVRDVLSQRENRVIVQSYAVEGKGDYLENRNALLLVRLPPGLSTNESSLQITGPEPDNIPVTTSAMPLPTGSPHPFSEEDIDSAPGSPPSLFKWFDAVSRWITCSLLGVKGCQDERTAMTEPSENETVRVPAEGPLQSQERYTLQVTTDPAGAALTLDSYGYQERTPVTINDVPAGKHQVLLEVEGCVPESRSITIDDNAEIFVTLAPPTERYKADSDQDEDSRLGGLYVESYPSSGEISIDGSSTGLFTPHVVYGMKEGSHTIRVTYDREGAEEYTARAWVTAGALSRVELNSGNHVKHSIEITSEEFKGTYFTVDGRYPRYRIPATVDIRAWQGFVTLMVNGSYLSMPVPASVADGETYLIKPEKIPLVTLSVDSDPRGARIFIDGFPGPETPALIPNVSAGRHLIALALDDHIPVEREILVTDLPDQEIDASFKGILVPYLSGAVALNSTPVGAMVYLNNRNTGLTTPVIIDHLPIGQIPLKIRYEKLVREPDIIILPGKTVSYHAQFT